MKTTFKFILSLSLLVFLASCSKDSVDEPATDESFLIEHGDMQRSNTLLAALVEGNTCASAPSGYGFQYTVYATAGANTVSYDRFLNVGIVDIDNNIVDSKILKIPANKSNARNVHVFSRAQGTVGFTTTRIFSVTDLAGNDLTSQYTLYDTTHTVNNCYQANGDGGDLDFCNGNDADGDGICDDIDPFIGDNGFQ